jgi:mannose-6-phosphate isomerase-like protein (cupin superfamily)
MAEAAKQEPVITMWSKEFTYDRWMKSKGIPIHTGYFIPDLRTVELEWWEERGCKAAFIQLLGQEGVSASRVTEVPPGKSLPPVKFALDEIVYVLSGRGLTTVWAGEGKAKKNFEWQEHRCSSVPRNHWHVFSNMTGDKPVQAFHLQLHADGDVGIARNPTCISTIPYEPKITADQGDFYSKQRWFRRKTPMKVWACALSGTVTFSPDMRAWNKLDANERRGAGGKERVHAVS